MPKSLLAAGLALALSTPSFAEPRDCLQFPCTVAAGFASISDSRAYGLLLAAPETGCRRVRFRVVVKGTFIGQTPPLAPGELAVVRLGRGFPEGWNEVLIAPLGCDAAPAAMRRVTLAKMAPDHGWRAARD